MELSSPRFKALTVSIGLSFWFFIIITALNLFAIEIFGIFIAAIFPLMQILSIKVSKALDKFAITNTKIFLGIMFVSIISLYGIFFKILRIDLLRLKSSTTYWLEMEQLDETRLLKQY